jgi:hypothetical protein
MDQGQIAEVDTPVKLFDQEGSIFRGMCDRSGIRRSDFFRDGEMLEEVRSGDSFGLETFGLDWNASELNLIRYALNYM